MHDSIIIKENVVNESFVDGLLSQKNYVKANALPRENDTEHDDTFSVTNYSVSVNHRCRIINHPKLNDDIIIDIFKNANNDHFKLDIDWANCTPVSYVKRYTEDDAGFLTWHDDILPDAHPEFGWRALSMSIILEDQFKGGDMEFKNSWDDKGIIYTPKLNKCSAVIFKPQLPHRVSLVTEGVRTALVTWLWTKENIYS